MGAKKGQAAIEFLMNYGWAVLIIAVAMTAILATGAFNPNYFVMEECYLGPAFNCQAQMVSIDPTHTKLLVKVTNVMSYPVKLLALGVSSGDLGSETVAFIPPASLDNSGSNVSSITFAAASVPGAIKRLQMNVTYKICAEELGPSCSDPRVATGRIITKVS